MAQFPLIGLDDQNEMQHDFFGQMMPQASASPSFDVNDNITDTTVFLKSR